MAILINIKNVKSNVIYLDDYRKKKTGTNTFFSNKLAKLNKEIAVHKDETGDIEKEIAKYEEEARKIEKELKESLYLTANSAKGYDGED